jgi:thiosulfate dehydrogenase
MQGQRLLPNVGWCGVMCLAMLAVACGPGERPPEQQSTAEAPEASKGEKETTDVQLCDGETTTAVPADMERTRENGMKIADALMAQWKRAHPEANWVEQEQEKHMIVPPHDNRALIGMGQGQTYGKITEVDVLTWERETIKFVTEGSRVFHSGDELGSQIAVSCDMCHPDASNTHPETYPKFQAQLGRVALLRDMINWCIEHPVRGQVLEPDDPKMRALEAYIYGQRKGQQLAYGKR